MKGINHMQTDIDKLYTYLEMLVTHILSTFVSLFNA